MLTTFFSKLSYSLGIAHISLVNWTHLLFIVFLDSPWPESLEYRLFVIEISDQFTFIVLHLGVRLKNLWPFLNYRCELVIILTCHLQVSHVSEVVSQTEGMIENEWAAASCITNKGLRLRVCNLNISRHHVSSTPSRVIRCSAFLTVTNSSLFLG